MKSSRFLFLLVALFFSKARAQDGKNCALWVATIYDNYVGPGGLTIKSPQVARLLGVAKQIDTLLKKNASFNSIPESRLRTYISLNKSVGVLGARINVIAYSKKGWDENCGIIPQADRIAANDGGLYFLVNAPWHLYVSSKQTDHIFGYLADVGAFVEPVLVEQRPNDIKIFMTGVTRQRFAMLTYDRQIPWMPFFIGEYLDAYATTFRKKEKELEAERKRASYYPADREREQKKIQQKYESIKKTDAGKAAEWLAMKKNNLVVADENYKRKLASLARRDSALQKEISAFEQFKATLDGQLQDQAFLGKGHYGLWQPGSAGEKRPLVKVKPGLFDNPAEFSKIKMITVKHLAETKWQNEVDRAFETLDVDKLKQLMK